MVGTFIAFSAYTPPLTLPHCTAGADGKSFSCTQKLALPTNPLVGKVSVDSIAGFAGGPAFLGKLDPVPEVKQVRITEVDIDGSAWGYQDPCGSPILAVSAVITIRAEGAPPLHMCSWSVVPGTDPDQLLAGHVTVIPFAGPVTSFIEVEIAIPQGDALDQYLSQISYPFQLLFQTNAGVRLISLPPIPALTDDQKTALQGQLVQAKVACKEQADGFWSATHLFNPKWSVDPGPEGEIDARWWGAAALGLSAGEQIEIQDTAGTTLVRSAPNAAGFARVDALTAPGADVAVVRAGAGHAATRSVAAGDMQAARSGERAADRRRMVISQTALRRAARLESRASCRAVEAGMLDGAPVAFFITETDVHELYDLSDPFRPALRRRPVVPGLRGVVSWGEHLMLWGAEGLGLVGRSRSCLPTPRSLRRRGVVAVTAHRQLTVHWDDGVATSYDTTFRPLPVEPRPPHRDRWPIAGWLGHAARVGSTLIQLHGLQAQVWLSGRTAIMG
jgi:hypothetical protein